MWEGYLNFRCISIYILMFYYIFILYLYDTYFASTFLQKCITCLEKLLDTILCTIVSRMTILRIQLGHKFKWISYQGIWLGLISGKVIFTGSYYVTFILCALTLKKSWWKADHSCEKICILIMQLYEDETSKLVSVNIFCP